MLAQHYSPSGELQEQRTHLSLVLINRLRRYIFYLMACLAFFVVYHVMCCLNIYPWFVELYVANNFSCSCCKTVELKSNVSVEMLINKNWDSLSW